MESRTEYAQQVIQRIYKRSVITDDQVSEIVEVSLPTFYKIIEALEGIDILTELTEVQ